jgi:S-formylglutathione hydrolase FrmB
MFFFLAALWSATAGVRFEVSLKPGLTTNELEGRLLVILNSTNRPEPRLALEDADARGPFVFGCDASHFASNRAVTIDDTATASLNLSLARLPAGHYSVQALFDVSTDLRSPNAAGNFMSEVGEWQLDSKTPSPVKLELTRRIFEERTSETDLVKLVKIPSRLLSEFHHRPMFLRAGIILPRTYAGEASRRYPLWIHLGGFGARYTRVDGMMEARSTFRAIWLATNAPQMIYVLPDGAGPNGDPYQVNSANNGPYGDAFTQELIPWIEAHFRGAGEPRARVMSGRSTGGWAALALQIFYPDFFNGAWAISPDSVDFRAFQLVNIYEEKNAFVNEHGEERPSARELNGDVHLLMRREVQLENVLGHGGQWTRSSGQWGAWNAVYGPRGADGQPVPLWDANGMINRAVAVQWQKYDLRIVLEKNWPTLAPKLRGKLHLWVGEADDYFLNNAVHLLDESLAAREPKDVATFTYGPGQGHGWMNISIEQLMEQLHAATEAKR